MFYGIFAVFMVLVVLYIAVAVSEYAVEMQTGRENGAMLLGGGVVLLLLSLWWLVDAVRGIPANTGIQVLRAIVILLIAGPILSPPVFAAARGGVRTLGRLRRLLWRPASIVGLVMIVLWFLS